MNMLFTTATLIATLLPSWTAQAFIPVVAPKATSMARYLSSSSSDSTDMPLDEKKMPFYALGTNFAAQVTNLNLKTLLKEDELDIVMEAFCAQLRGDIDDTGTILATYGPRINTLLQDRTRAIAEKEKKESRKHVAKFMDDHRAAIKTESGLVYLETTKGTGASPTMESEVAVHYHGMLLKDGTVVDSSVDRGGQPISFPLNSVIPGWAEGLCMMKEGGKATLVIPSDLAYGDSGAGEVIPPGATLKFLVELFKVESSSSSSSTPSDNVEQGETEQVELPDGTKVRVPKGVKVRMVDAEE